MKGNQLILVAFCRKNSNMEIFGRHIFGSDAQQFIDLCFDDQVKWIEKYTNQILSGKGINDCTCGLSKKMPYCDGSHKSLR